VTVPLEYKNASREFEQILLDARDGMGVATTNMSYTAVQAVLTVFRRRLDPTQVADFSRLLPAVLCAVFISDWHPHEPPVPFSDRAEMTREVQAFRGDHNFSPDTAIGDFAAVLRKYVHARQLEEVLARMPAEASEFWSAGQAGA